MPGSPSGKIRKRQAGITKLQVESKSEVSPFASFPMDLISHVQSFLPTYKFFGQHAIGYVSRRFNFAQNERMTKGRKANPYDFVDKTRSAIISSCRSHEDVLNILKDERLLMRLTLKEILGIISQHPQMAIELIRTVDDFRFYHVILLGSKEESVAKYIVSNRELVETDDLAKLSQNHGPIALHLLDNPDWRDSAYENDLIALGSKHLVIAELILANHGNVLKDVDENEIKIGLAEYHLTIAEGVFNDDELIDTLDFNVVISLASKHLTLAERILNEPDIWNDLDAAELVILGQNHLAIAERILKNEKFKSILNHREIVLLCENHLSLADRIFEIDKMKPVDGEVLMRLGTKHASIAHRFLNDDIFRNRLTSEILSKFGRKHHAIAKQILQDPELRGRLDGFGLAFLGCNHWDIAMQILQDDDLKRKLDNRDLIRLGQKTPSIAKYILNNFTVDDVRKENDSQTKDTLMPLSKIVKIYDLIHEVVKMPLGAQAEHTSPPAIKKQRSRGIS